jgi:nicotinate-nucleotide adenylyltransferase
MKNDGFQLSDERVRPIRLGIAGGTFDPIHIGHLIIAEVARQEYGLDKVVFIPTGIPPHKTGYAVTPAVHRYEMTRIAIMDNPYFEISDVETSRQGFTYTIDTLRELKRIYPKGVEFFFIIGSDTLPEVKGWKEASRVVKDCCFVVYHRPGYDVLEEEMRFLCETMGALVCPIRGPLLDISSTDIRERIKQGKSIRYLVPPKVEEYIYRNLLYREGE